MPEKHFLRQMQALPLRAKIAKSQLRIREWYEHFDGNVCISFSGGKDSTVLATLVHDIYPDVPMVFCNTGLEYPEIQAFAKKMGAEFVRPKMRFDEVISKYGYPIISKENAEAIHYARKIRNSYRGGVYTLSDRENNSLADDAIPRSNGMEKSSVIGSNTAKENWGGVSGQKRRELNGSRVTKDPNLCMGGGGITETHLRRSDIMNLRMEFNREKQKVRGSDGEETASPG